MVEGLIAGTLVGLAETRQGKNGTTFALAKVKAQTGDGEHIIVNVIAFAAETSAALMALDDGDAVSVAGALTPKVWTDKQGNTRPALDMVGTQVLTAYHAARKQQALQDQSNPDQASP
ncbi:MAG: single-stranded DNA-binding protein [Rhodoferax sp.]|nr:single-stranded DNA-binding protein [Rhodoferax sp.]